MRRRLFASAITAVLVVAFAAPAAAGHCINLSKPDGAGTVDVLLSPDGELLSQPTGGYADLHIDFNDNGIADETELVAEDVLIGRNHSPQFETTDGGWVNPGAVAKASKTNAAHDSGMNLPHED